MKGRVEHEILKDGKGNLQLVSLNARKAIRLHCQECMGFNANDVRRCSTPTCALFPFRIAGKPEYLRDLII